MRHAGVHPAPKDFRSDYEMSGRAALSLQGAGLAAFAVTGLTVWILLETLKLGMSEVQRLVTACAWVD